MSPLGFALPGGSAVFTGRAEGNLSSVGGEGRADAAAARERLRRSIGVERLARGYQVHGTHVTLLAERAPADAAETVRADGQATALRGIGAMVLTADCVPVAIGAPGAVAMLHAGWRGLAAGVVEHGVLALAQLAPGEPLAAVVGPCAGACCYEVGPEVHAAFGARRARGTLDLRALAHERLRASGVAVVEDAEACTICDPRFFSHRREGGRAGRQAGVAWLS